MRKVESKGLTKAQIKAQIRERYKGRSLDDAEVIPARKQRDFYDTDEHQRVAVYKKLWKLLIDKDMKKKDLCAKAGISPASVTKMGRNGFVTTEVLEKICVALECQIGDVMEIIPEVNGNGQA